jgi:hypothetical protein
MNLKNYIIINTIKNQEVEAKKEKLNKNLLIVK